MNDDELIDALRTGLDAVDPAPPTLLAKALAAGTWPTTAATEALPRTDADLVGAGMRSSEPSDSDDAETSRDLSFDAAGHTIDITVEFADRGASGAELIIIVAPRVDHVTIVSPFDEPTVAELGPAGRASLRVESRAVAVEFVASSGAVVRTPLIRLS